ncbi:hypothetical protein Dsin_001918 [Dipteronia sinensis]|uniref:RNase H type-1 domain-containing protein n=1 Tax=Dipteronia sinensis TaxID=43782 RepID=A0AAE0B672_9ROSI|nr:hypothetical protein Dsin_001918 [Dipteronia sinensis]
MKPTSSALCGDWILPCPSLLKLKSGVANRKGAWAAGVGVAIRDDKGRVFTAMSKPLTGSFSTEVGELLALREGLLLAKAHCLSVQIVEDDVPLVASALNSLDTLLWDASFIINDIRGLFPKLENLYLSRQSHLEQCLGS